MARFRPGDIAKPKSAMNLGSFPNAQETVGEKLGNPDKWFF
jgi:hypothetical protein